MKQFHYVIAGGMGIHARPAGILAAQALKFKSMAIIKKGSQEADAKCLPALMNLSVKQGDSIQVLVTGADEEQACEVLLEVFNQYL